MSMKRPQEDDGEGGLHCGVGFGVVFFPVRVKAVGMFFGGVLTGEGLAVRMTAGPFAGRSAALRWLFAAFGSVEAGGAFGGIGWWGWALGVGGLFGGGGLLRLRRGVVDRGIAGDLWGLLGCFGLWKVGEGEAGEGPPHTGDEGVEQDENEGGDNQWKTEVAGVGGGWAEPGFGEVDEFAAAGGCRGGAEFSKALGIEGPFGRGAHCDWSKGEGVASRLDGTAHDGPFFQLAGEGEVTGSEALPSDFVGSPPPVPSSILMVGGFWAKGSVHSSRS